MDIKPALENLGDLFRIVRSRLSGELIYLSSRQAKRQGESICFYTISMICVQTGQLIVSDANGKLKVTRAHHVYLSSFSDRNRVHCIGSIFSMNKLSETENRLGFDRMSIRPVPYASCVSISVWKSRRGCGHP